MEKIPTIDIDNNSVEKKIIFLLNSFFLSRVTLFKRIFISVVLTVSDLELLYSVLDMSNKLISFL